VNVKEITAKTILRKHKKIDSWFLSRYGMNLYRGCSHNCVYCDGRSEKYNVDGEFGEDVYVKVNAIDILKRELDPTKKRSPFKKGYIMVGGGVGDSYQNIEKEYELTRKTLNLLLQKKFPLHILTKSTLVERDIELLKKINEKNRAIVSFSFSSTNEQISSIFEPCVPSPKERLECMKKFKDEGIAIGMFLMPVIPFITDNPKIIEKTIKDAYDIDIDFIIFSGMTLKPGRQIEFFYSTLNQYYPDLIIDYKTIYKGDKWGGATKEYYDSINNIFYTLAKQYKIPMRIPKNLYSDILEENDKIIVLLEHIDYLLRLRGMKSPYGYAAFSLSKIKEPLSSIKNNLIKIKGVGKTTERIILEILNTGTSEYYEKLMKN
jgi:DNA repair photolyase